MVNHSDDQCSISALYNLPCFHALYKDKLKRPLRTADTMNSECTESAMQEEIKFESDLNGVEDIDF